MEEISGILYKLASLKNLTKENSIVKLKSTNGYEHWLVHGKHPNPHINLSKNLKHTHLHLLPNLRNIKTTVPTLINIRKIAKSRH